MAGYFKAEKTGRNDPFPCGSGLKYKKCCIDGRPKVPMALDINARAMQMFEKHRAKQRLRQAQQGYGRPISAFQHAGSEVTLWPGGGAEPGRDKREVFERP